MKFTHAFNQTTVTTMAAMGACISGPRLGQRITIGSHGKSVRSLGHLATTGNPNPLQAELGNIVL